MSSQVVRKTLSSIALVGSAISTANLLLQYLDAVFRSPSAQWQFAFVLLPVPIALGLIAAAISWIWQPPLPRTIRIVCVAALVAPLTLGALVWFHIY
jgi:hypothetical protein